jgi:hypothetical protein
MKISIIYNISVPQKTNIACFKHNRVETNCSKVGVIGFKHIRFIVVYKKKTLLSDPQKAQNLNI